MSNTKWIVKVNQHAIRDIEWLNVNHPECADCVKEAMRQLSVMDDPRCHPKVSPIRHDAPGWYRYKIFYPNIRVVFRLLEGKGHIIYEVHPQEKLDTGAARMIQVTRAGFRSGIYGEGLKHRHDRIRHDDDF